MAGPFNDKRYPNCPLQFVDRLGNPAAIDQSTKPLRVEFQAGEDLCTLANFQPQGATLGAFTCDMTPGDGVAGAVAGDIIADPDLTPEGEAELRVPFAFVIQPAGATGGSFSLSGGVDK